MGLVSVQAKLDDKGIDLDLWDSATVEGFHRGIAGIAQGAHAEWMRIAQNRLRTSRAIYINGLQQAESFTTRVVGTTSIFEITLVGRMPNAFEFGMPAFDMKEVRPGWLGGRRAKTAKDGHKYIVIPFRHSLTSGASLAYSGKARREDVISNLKEVVRKHGLNRMVRGPGGRVLTGPVKRLPPGQPNVHRFLEGLTRVQDRVAGRTPSGKEKGSGQLMTWRVMSDKSPPGSWIHPGLTAEHHARG